MDYQVYNLSMLPDNTADMSLLDEHDTASAMQRRGSFATIRSLLRKELSRRCGIAPQNIHFSYSEMGKPEFGPQPFNLSHSGDCLCLAFHHEAVGVDVERMKPRAFDKLAPRFMSAEQLTAFLGRGCPAEEFYACWCAAEALVKRCGASIWDAHRFPFLYQHGRIICQFEASPVVRLFTPMPDYMGAVAF